MLTGIVIQLLVSPSFIILGFIYVRNVCIIRGECKECIIVCVRVWINGSFVLCA